MPTKYWSTLLIFLIALLVYTSFIGQSEGENKRELARLLRNIQSPHELLINDYESFLLDQIDSTNTVGAAVAIVSYDSLIYLNTFGVRKSGTADSVDIHTVFRLASVSKGFAGVLACILDRDSILGLDERIIDLLPGFELKDSANTNSLTIQHTLNHTSGLVPHAYDNLVEADVSMSEIISKLKDVDISANPGEIYGYQNAVFSLIDTVLEAKTQKSYAYHLMDKVFKPLGMTNASTENLVDSLNMAFPHVIASGRYVPDKINSRYYSASPAAGVNASISDMSKWLKALLGGSSEVLDSAVLNKIVTPTIYTPLKRRYTRRWGTVTNRHYSLGWRIYDFHDRDIVYHGGYVRGYKAEIAFCPEERTGIVFLQNSPNRLGSMSVPEFWKRYFAFKEKYSLRKK